MTLAPQRSILVGTVATNPSRHGPAGAEGDRAAWSRRRFVAHGLLTLAAAPALARALDPPARAETPPDLSATNAGSDSAQGTGTGTGTVRSAGVADQRLTTAVLINGAGPYRFLVDSGAERSLMASEIATELALPQGRAVMIEGIVRGEQGVLVDIESLRMGSLVCPALEVPVLPRAMLGVDGYLGLDVLDRHRVILDFRAETISVTRPQGFFAAWFEGRDEVIVRTLGSSGRLRASNCMVNGVRAAAFIDTGAEVSVINPALYAALQVHAPTGAMVGGSVELSGVTGGTVVGLAINVNEIILGELHLVYTPMVVAPLDVFDVWGLSAQPALLFGMDCLRRFRRVTIDYGREELRFEVARAALAQPLQAELWPRSTG
jgi:predicted aspartyl protease